MMIFRQLFEPDSSTYTYLLGCPETGSAVLIDPVLETAERDLDAVRDLGLRLAWTVETHVHADHVTAAARLRSLSGCRIAFPAGDEIIGADIYLSELQGLEIGAIALKPLFTPGHTDHHHCYLAGGRVFTGDALLIDGCGRTDFQGGCAATLYRSVRDKIFTLPDETLVYPAHDYRGREVSSVGLERERNARLGGERTEAEFVEIMAALDLPYPRKIDIAVPANRLCGAMQATVRTARLEDLPAVERVFEASFPALMAGAYDRSLLARALPLMISAQPSLVGSGNYHVAEADGEVVGCGGWSHEKPGSAETAPGVGHIRHFAVSPGWTGRGIGRAIYSRCEAQARAQGVRALECYSSLNGEPFYRALRFSRLAPIEVEMGPAIMFPSIHMRRAI